MPIRLRLEPWREIDQEVELSATLHLPGRPTRLWWRVPAAWRESLTTWADPFVIGLLFEMMAAGEDVEVDAAVSPSLLANLEPFMDIWSAWVPAKYRRVRIVSPHEVESPEPSQPAQLVMPFSCGGRFLLHRIASPAAPRGQGCEGCRARRDDVRLRHPTRGSQQPVDV
jgi:hypothetical protein